MWDAAGLAALIEHSADIIAVLDANGALRFANPAAQRLLGHQAGSLLGTVAFDLVHPEDTELAAKTFVGILESDDEIDPIELRLRDQRGGWRHVEVVAHNLLATPGVAGVVLNIHDITERLAAEDAQRVSEARFRHLADSAPDLIFRYRVADTPGFEYLSPAALELTGHSPDDLIARPELLDELLSAEVQATLARLDSDDELRRPIEFEIRHADGRAIWVQLRLTAHRDEDGSVVSVDGIMRDTTERKSAEEALLHRTLHDPLTGLPNRTLFYDRLNHALRRSDRLPSSPAVLFLDLDGFKGVNDEHGHAAGDLVLSEVAGRLTASVRPSDTVARLGGDEFLVLCDDIADDFELGAICDRLRRCVRSPIEVDGHSITVGVSIGATRAGADATADELLKLADRAMYQDKHQASGG